MVVALIPARGGSKRLPRKNLKLFAGRPLIYYSIALAQALTQIDRCIVSTEDKEIGAVAEELGAEVVDRPAELATDFASTASVAQHVLGQLTTVGHHADTLVTLQPNCPLRPLALVQDALDLFSANDVDSVISVTQSHQKVGEIKDQYFVPDYEPGIRSQDMGPKYFENGLVYVSRASMVLETGELFGRKMFPLITDPLYALGDIDTELDFQLAEFIFERYRDHFSYAH